MKILLTADWHAGIKTDDVDGSRLEELRIAIKRMVDEDPDLLIIAGDVFHSNHPSVETVLAVQGMLKPFRRVIIIPGNHDFNFTGRSPVALLVDPREPSEKEAFRCLVYEGAQLAHIDGVHVLCIPPAATPEAMLNGITSDDFKAADFIVGHWMPEGCKGGIEETFFSPGAQRPVLPKEAKGKTLMLGHCHKVRIEGALVPGSLQRLDFGDDPDGEKGYIRLTGRSGAWGVVSMPVPARAYVTLGEDGTVDSPDDPRVEGAVVRVRLNEQSKLNAVELEASLRRAGAHVVRPIEIVRAARRPRVDFGKGGCSPEAAVAKYCKANHVSDMVREAALSLLTAGEAE